MTHGSLWVIFGSQSIMGASGSAMGALEARYLPKASIKNCVNCLIMPFQIPSHWVSQLHHAFAHCKPFIKDQYHELLKVSQMDLTDRKGAGFGHDVVWYSMPGDLAIFCPACPQPEINLPEHWTRSMPDACFLGWCSRFQMLIVSGMWSFLIGSRGA